MTVEEAIQFTREVAEGSRCECYNRHCLDCEEDHKQMAKWLEELLEKRCKVIVQANRIKELEAEVQEQLTKRQEAYDRLYAAQNKIDDLLKQRAK